VDVVKDASVAAARAVPARPRLRVLLSAYACEPSKGSEPGIGWNWALGLARAGHEVWVLTRANNRAAIEQALAAAPESDLRSKLHFIYYDLPAWARWWKRGARGVRTYYLLWQWGAYRRARRLCRETRLDLVHHLTFGVFRHPSFMGLLGLPFVFGPVGGGETAPRALRGSFPLRGVLADFARDLANWLVRVDPLMASVYRRAAVTLCKTAETLNRIPGKYRGKCRVHLEVGTREDAHPLPRRHAPHERFRVLYVGRLIYWKGLHLGMMAFARLLERHPEAHLTVVGSGPDESWLHALAQRLGIDAQVTWMRWLERDAVLQVYPRHDVFLYPSLHDSSGNAVLEALTAGLPVVCLHLGGPGELVDGSCGVRVFAGKSAQVVRGLCRALTALADEPRLLQRMSDSAMRRARTHYSWRRQIERMEALYFELHAARAAALPAPGGA
jgi:glycosyltransferase involved in cell wall biosynthesis